MRFSIFFSVSLISTTTLFAGDHSHSSEIYGFVFGEVSNIDNPNFSENGAAQIFSQ